MLWKEISIGFLIAGFVALLPMDVFNSLFLTDAPGWVQLLENVVVGPIVAILSFVCSIGNVPLAAVLWAGGISFSGVIAFIYADLLIVPILLIYRRYYGGRVTVRLVAIMFAAIVVSALVVNALFARSASCRPSGRRSTRSRAARSPGTTRRRSTSCSRSWRCCCSR